MPKISTFSEDMVPRQFPKKLNQSSVVPVPASLCVSSIFDDENIDSTIISSETSEKGMLQDTFVLTGFSSKYKKSSEKQQNSNNKPVRQKVHPKLELTFYESPVLSNNNDCKLKRQPESQQYQKQSILNEEKNNSGSSLSFSDQRVQQKLNINERSHCFQEIQNYCQTMTAYNNHIYDNGKQNIEPSFEQLEEQSLIEQQNTNGEPRKKPKEEVANDTLVGIIEDQKQHIFIQKKQISLQKKQNLMQKKQIFALQSQIHQIELENDNTECKSRYLDHSKPKPLKNRGSNTKVRSFEGVTGLDLLTSNNSETTTKNKFTSKLNQCNFNDITFKYGNSTLLSLNNSSKNSAMCETKNGAAYDCVSLIPNTEMNVTAQTLIYEESRSNCAYFGGYMNEIEDTDSCFAFHVLDMNYSHQVSNLAQTTFEHQHQLNAKVDDTFSVTTSPDVYDYLMRHRLLENPKYE